MKSIVTVAALAAGGVGLFGLSFFGVTLASGAPMGEVAVVGGLFGEDESASQPAADPSPPSSTFPTGGPGSANKVVGRQLGVLSSFALPLDVDAQELRLLTDQLRTRTAALDARERDLDDRARELDDREAELDEQALQLEEQLSDVTSMQGNLEHLEDELDARDAASAAELDEYTQGLAWDATAKLFAKGGDITELAAQIQQFPPSEAAQILRRLKPDRARDLLAELPTNTWAEYQQAYATASAEAAAAAGGN